MDPDLSVSASVRAEPAVRRLGRYELIQLLAKGGMGEVHLARTRGVGGFERLVVIKCALPALADRSRTMLLAEARLAATLRHTNIVQVHDVGTEGETVFLAMEYLHGQDVRAVLRRAWVRERLLPLDQALAIALAVCAGLHYAHDKRDSDGCALEIVHRDVSPSNVFVTYDGGVKLIDFGIAKATTLPSETQLGTVKGKPGYMSPEQVRCEPLDRRSDVFGIGILVYELTTGRRAFRADNEYLLTKQILDDHPARPTEIDAAYPAALEAIVMRALAKDRRERHPTALALQDELAAFATERRLDLSQLALGRLMASLFDDELAAWQDAQRAGQSFVEHVIKRTTTTAAIISDSAVGTAQSPATPTADLRAPARPRRGWIAATLAAAAVAIAATIVVTATRHDARPSSPTPDPLQAQTRPEPSPPAREPPAKPAVQPKPDDAPTPAGNPPPKPDATATPDAKPEAKAATLGANPRPPKPDTKAHAPRPDAKPQPPKPAAKAHLPTPEPEAKQPKARPLPSKPGAPPSPLPKPKSDAAPPADAKPPEPRPVPQPTPLDPDKPL